MGLGHPWAMQCLGDTQRFSGASTILNVCGTHRGIPHPLPHPCCIPSSWRRGSEWELSLPPSPGKNVTHVCSPPYTGACGMSPWAPPQPEAARGRRQGAPGVLLLPWSLPGAELPQAVALPPQSLPFPEQLLWDGSGPGRCCCFVSLGTGGGIWGLRGCTAGPGPLVPQLPSPACLAGAVTHSCSSAITHVSQSQPGTLGRGKQIPGCTQWTLGRALPIFPMATHIQSTSGRWHW